MYAARPDKPSPVSQLVNAVLEGLFTEAQNGSSKANCVRNFAIILPIRSADSAVIVRLQRDRVSKCSKIWA